MSKLLLLLLLAILSQSAVGAERPNVLLIMVDDLRPELGAYGNSRVKTPNIDRLASQGVLFENAFASVPVCGASRASLFSGRKPTTNRFIFYNSRLDEDLPEAISLPGHFRQHGYTTLANGKVFDDTRDSSADWSEPVWSPSGDWNSPIPPSPRGEHLQKAYLNSPAGVPGPPWERLEVSDTAYPDGKLAEKAVSDLKRLKRAGNPFFMAVGFRKPHLPFNAPARYWDLYQESDFALPSTYRERSTDTPNAAYHRWLELRAYAQVPPEGPLSDEQALRLIHGYYASVSYSDALVGKVLDALEAEGLSENTVVVLLGDHGFMLGDHTMWTKHCLFDIALRTPLIIRDPTRGNGRVSGVVSFLDLFPTLTDLTGLPSVPGQDGVSLVRTLHNTELSVHDAVLSRWFNGLSVRTDNYRYTEWRNESDEIIDRMLFDVKLDPAESRNIVADPALAGVVGSLSRLITEDDSNSEWSELVRRYVGSSGL